MTSTVAAAFSVSEYECLLGWKTGWNCLFPEIGPFAAFMRGDTHRWSELVRIAADFTLMQPFGGPLAAASTRPQPAQAMADRGRREIRPPGDRPPW